MGAARTHSAGLTLVIYMGVSGVARIRAELLHGQRHTVCTLARLQAIIAHEQLMSPSVIVVGEVIKGVAAAAVAPGAQVMTGVRIA